MAAGDDSSSSSGRGSSRPAAAATPPPPPSSASSAWAAWATRFRGNLAVSRKSFLAESSGALGDLGTFVPIVLALALVTHLDLGTTLVFTGAYNLVTGALFGVPMPVQPMKSIAAAAITEGDPMTVPQIMAAGLATAAALLLLGVTGLMTWVQWLVPLPVVRGIQLQQGLSFGQTAVKYVLKEQEFATGKAGPARPWWGLDGKVVALLAFAFVVLATGTGDGGGGGGGGRRGERERHQVRHVRQRIDRWVGAGGEGGGGGGEGQQQGEGEEERGGDEAAAAAAALRKPLLLPTTTADAQQQQGQGYVVPAALIVFLVGVVLAFVRDPSIFGRLTFGPSPLQIIHISWSDWKTGIIRGTVPQLPLSLLNSVVAVVKLSEDLFPAAAPHVTALSVSTSVGLMNLVGCWLGAMPVCHGAGGLAGQYRFGARTGASVALLGALKLALGLALGGSSLLALLQAFPIGLLGVLLLFAGVELAAACRDQASRADALVMLVTAVAGLAASAALGFVAGLVLVLLLKLREGEFDVRDRARRAVQWSRRSTRS